MRLAPLLLLPLLLAPASLLARPPAEVDRLTEPAQKTLLLARRDRPPELDGDVSPHARRRPMQSNDSGQDAPPELSPHDAAETALRQHEGRVVGVRRQVRGNGRGYYSVKLLGADGRLRIVEVPARDDEP